MTVELSDAEIVARVVAVLPACDDLRRRPWRGNSNPVAGHCYVASEALYHALGWREWRPVFLRHEKSPHWFLWRRGSWSVDDVLDVTAGQFREPPPYLLGRGRGFLTIRPSKRAVELLRRAAIPW